MNKSAKRGSLKAKIIAWSFIPTVIILVAVAWFTFYSYQRVTEDLATNQDKEVTSLEGSKYAQAFLILINRPLIDLFFTYTEVEPHQILEVARSVAGKQEVTSVFDGGIALLDRDGKIVFSQPDAGHLMGENWNDYPFVKYAQTTLGRAGISGLLERGPDGHPAVGIALALHSKESGPPSGTLLLFFKIVPDQDSQFNQVFSSVIPTAGVTYLVDNQNYILFHPDTSRSGTPYTGATPWYDLGVDEDGVGWVRERQQDLVMSYGPVIATPDTWYIVREQSWQALMTPSLGYRRFLLFLLALGVIVPTLVVAFGVNHITRPIEDLIYAAKSVAGGQFNRRITANTGDELQELADQFNVMTVKLQESYSTLEQRVAERTRQLSTVNAIANVASQSLDLEEILTDALEKTLELTILEAGAAYKVDRINQSLVLMAYHGIPVDQVREITHLNLAEDENLERLFSTEILEIDLHELPAGKMQHLLEEIGIHRLVILPLIAHSQPTGYFCLGAYEERGIPESDLSLLRAIGQQIGIAIENALLYERAEELAVAAERSRLARELHDAVTQTLFSASLIAEVLPELTKINPDEAARKITELRQLTRGALAEMRTLLLELRPNSLTELSLSDLLAQLAEAANSRGRVTVEISVEGAVSIPLEVKQVYYRIAQEALNNTVKHARATKASICLVQTGAQLCMTIRDDGRGFDPQHIRPESMGLTIMRERSEAIGAELRIESVPQEGTCITVCWQPVNSLPDSEGSTIQNHEVSHEN